MSGLKVWHSIEEGYKECVTEKNIISGFAKSGLWPLNPHKLCENGIRYASNDVRLLRQKRFTKEFHVFNMDYKRKGLSVVKVRGGYVNTAHGIELTREDGKKEIQALEEHRLSRRTEREEHAGCNEFRKYIDREKRRKFFEKVQLSKANDRSRCYGKQVTLLCTFWECGLQARHKRHRKELEAQRAMCNVHIFSGEANIDEFSAKGARNIGDGEASRVSAGEAGDINKKAVFSVILVCIEST